MILPTACINWAALRSGLSLPDFMASLNPQREEEILKSYNAWRKDKGLPEVRPVAAEPRATKPQPSTQGDDVDKPQADDAREPQADDLDEPQDDDISGLVSKIADQVAREELEEAELIQEALRLPEERIPRELEEELEMEAMAEEADTAQAAASQAATEPQVEANTEPQAATASSEAAATVPSEVAATALATAPSEAASTEPAEPTTASEEPSKKKDLSTSAPQVEPDGPIMEADISERFLTIARTLPKVADPALYQEILAQLDAPAEVVKSLAEETRKLYTAKHRSTVGLRAFIEWLSNNQHPL